MEAEGTNSYPRWRLAALHPPISATVMASSRKVAISGKFAVKLTKWLVKQGQEVARDEVLARYVFNDGNSPDAVLTERKLKSRFNGKVVKLLAAENEQVQPRFFESSLRIWPYLFLTSFLCILDMLILLSTVIRKK